MYYIGIDLGTSSLKGLLADANGKIIKEASASYPVYSMRECGIKNLCTRDKHHTSQKLM